MNQKIAGLAFTAATTLMAASVTVICAQATVDSARALWASRDAVASVAAEAVAEAV
jgi:hypothetical protein